MAAGFMVRRVQFLSKVLLSLLLTGCNKEPQVAIPAGSPGLEHMNGSLYFNNQLFTGTLFTLYTGTGDTASISGYKKGLEHGAWRKLYPSGQLKEKRLYDNGHKTGTYTAWWNNGTKQLEYHFADDEYEGTCREWNDAGVLIREMNYKKGHEEGTQKLFYDNGKVRANYTIINGRRYGLLGTKNCVNVTDSIFTN